MRGGDGFRLRWLSLSGIASRRTLLAWLLLAVAAVLLGRTIERQIPPPGLALRLGAVLPQAILLPGFAAALVRRLHATGRSGWWALTVAIPYLGVLPLILFLLDRQRTLDWTPRTGQVLGSALLAVAALVILSRALWSPYTVADPGMKPDLVPGDTVAVIHRAGSRLHPGDIVVARDPRSGQDVIGRLVGRPGDVVQMKGGTLYVNGTKARQRPVADDTEPFVRAGPQAVFPRCNNNPGIGGTCRKRQAIETLPSGATHPVLDAGSSPADDTPAFTVPSGQLFLLGDNRDVAIDSRYAHPVGFGTVKIGDVLGRAARILYSAGGRSPLAFWTWRPGRVLQGVR